MKQFRDTVYYLTDDYQVININTGRIKKQSRTKQGYIIYALYYSGKTHTTYLHRIVKEVYDGYSDLTVDHLDGNKENNHISNLEYCTNRENCFRGKNRDPEMRGINKSNGYYRYYVKNKYIRGSSCKTLEQVKLFKKEYERKNGKL